MKISDVCITDTCIIAVHHRAPVEVLFFDQPDEIADAISAFSAGKYDEDAGLHDLQNYYVLPADAATLRKAVSAKSHGWVELAQVMGAR